MDEQIRELQVLLDNSRFTLVITGAGISVSAGIPTMHGLNIAKTMQFVSMRLLKSAPKHYYRVARHSFMNAIFENGPSSFFEKGLFIIIRLLLLGFPRQSYKQS